MIDREAYLALMTRVVAEVAPDEIAAFEISAPAIANELYERGSLEELRSAGSEEFQFIDTAKQVLEFVTLMVGTFEALRKLYRSFKKSKDVTELKAKWLVELRTAGLPADVADQVVTKFSADLEQAINKTKTASSNG
jgi:hypothetical protein